VNGGTANPASARAETPSSAVELDPCPSCGERRMERFCAACGERRPREDDYSLRAFLAQAVSSVTDLDSKLLRTLRLLVARPGELTREHMAGRRVPYLGPLRLFLVANVVFFLAQSLTGSQIFTSPLRIHMYSLPHAKLARVWVADRLQERGISTLEYAAAFDLAVQTQARTLVIVMVPVLALLLWLVVWRPRREYVAHLVFALHFYAFFMLLAVVISGLLEASWFAGVEVSEGEVSLVALTALAIYLAAATRRAYGWRRAVSVPAGVALAICVGAVLYLYRLILFFTAFAVT
jgi:hypothetical protein